jgi:hypothetical protein
MTTGYWAFPDVIEEWVCGEWNFAEFQPQLEKFLRLYGEPGVIVAEKPQLMYPGHLQEKLRKVVSQTEQACPNVQFVTPSRWKPSHANHPVPMNMKTTPHMRDAYRMGIWYLDSTPQ